MREKGHMRRKKKKNQPKTCSVELTRWSPGSHERWYGEKKSLNISIKSCGKKRGRKNYERRKRKGGRKKKQREMRKGKKKMYVYGLVKVRECR